MENKPWYKSVTMWGLILTAVGTFFKQSPETVAFITSADTAEALATIGSGIGIIVAGWGRMRATKGIGK
jgi:hypothetical protein